MKNKNELFFNNTFFTEKVIDEKLETKIEHQNNTQDYNTFFYKRFNKEFRIVISSKLICSMKKLS